MEKNVFIITTEEQVIKRTSTTAKLPLELKGIYRDLHRYASLLSPGSAAEFLLYLLTKMTDDNEVIVNQELITTYSEKISMNITERTFFRMLKNLVNNGALAKQSRGVYLISPSVIHGRLGIPLEMPSVPPLEEKRSVLSSDPVVEESLNLLEEIADKLDKNHPEHKTTGLEDFTVRDTKELSPVVEMPDEIENMFLPDILTHTEVMSVEEAKELYPDKAKEIEQVLKASVFDHGPGGMGDKPLTIDDIVLPVVVEKKQPKLNLYGGKTFRV